MPITRIEMVAATPRTQEATHQRQNEVARNFAENANITDHFHDQIQHNGQQTVKTSKSEDKEKRYDAKEKGKNSYQGKDQKKEKNDSKEENEIKLSSFDIKI